MTETVCFIGLGIGKTNGAYVGGHVNNVVNSARQLARRGHDVHIVTTPPIHQEHATQSVKTLEHGVRVHTVQPLFTKTTEKVSTEGKRSLLYGAGALPSLVSKIRRLHSRYDFDLLHSHSGYPWVATIPATANTLRNIPTVHTLYCPIPTGAVYRTATKGTLFSFDSIIFVSENVRRSLPGLPGGVTERTIPPLIDIERFSESDAADVADAPTDGRDGPDLLFVGNFSETKGLDVLLDAIAELRSEYPELTLNMAFDMPVSEYENSENDVKQQIAELGLDEYVNPVGIVDDLPALMHASDVFIAPFRNTHGPADYPLSLLEAMSSGLPVVASNVGGISEVIDHRETGLLCPPSDPSELAGEIRAVLDDQPFRERLGSQGAGAVRELNEGIVTNILDVYDTISP